MVELSQLEELQKIRAELENESRSLKEERIGCEEMVKVLEEKIAIEELKKDNKSTREAISQLKSKIDELNQRLTGLSTREQTVPPLSEDAKPEATAEAPQPAGDEFVTVTAFEDSVETQQEEAVEQRRKEEKKRRFF